MSASKQRRITVRVSEDLDRWLKTRVGGTRGKAALIRGLIERERASERERELLEMFDRAAEDLTEDDRAERERLIAAFHRG